MDRRVGTVWLASDFYDWCPPTFSKQQLAEVCLLQDWIWNLKTPKPWDRVSDSDYSPTHTFSPAIIRGTKLKFKKTLGEASVWLWLDSRPHWLKQQLTGHQRPAMPGLLPQREKTAPPTSCPIFNPVTASKNRVSELFQQRLWNCVHFKFHEHFLRQMRSNQNFLPFHGHTMQARWWKWSQLSAEWHHSCKAGSALLVDWY